MNQKITLKSLAKMIDHSLVGPTITDDDVIQGCLLAREFDVATVCVKPYTIPLTEDLVDGTDVQICSVAGFPHGCSSVGMKMIEAENAIDAGAAEIDFVVNLGKVVGGDWAYVSREIKTINDSVKRMGAISKVIFENDFLNDNQIIKLCKICSEHQVAFVKTSTGYGFVKQENGSYAYQGATDHHLKLMREHVDPTIQIKAAGGVRTLDDLLRVRELGVTRIGATATREILEAAKQRGFPA